MTFVPLLLLITRWFRLRVCLSEALGFFFSFSRTTSSWSFIILSNHQNLSPFDGHIQIPILPPKAYDEAVREDPFSTFHIFILASFTQVPHVVSPHLRKPLDTALLQVLALAFIDRQPLELKAVQLGQGTCIFDEIVVLIKNLIPKLSDRREGHFTLLKFLSEQMKLLSSWMLSYVSRGPRSSAARFRRAFLPTQGSWPSGSRV